MRIDNGMEKIILKKKEAIALRDAYAIIEDIYNYTECEEVSKITDELIDLFGSLLFSLNDNFRIYYEEPEKKEKITLFSLNFD